MTRHQLLVARGREIIQATNQLFIDLDVEADGPAGIGSLLSVGAITPWGETFYRELRPTDKPGTPGSRKFCEEHNLQRERLLVEGTDPGVAMTALATWVKSVVATHGKTEAVLVAFPSWFDFGLINTTMLENGVPNPFGLEGLCTQSLALALSPTYDWNNVSKQNMPPELIPPGEFTHNALEDAIYQQQMHFALAGLLSGTV